MFKFESVYKGGASFGDVWHNRHAIINVQGQQKTLQEFFQPQHWLFLRDLHSFVIGALHGNRLPRDPRNPKGYRIVLPSEFNDIQLVSEIAALANIIVYRDEIVIVDAQVVSPPSDTTEE